MKKILIGILALGTFTAFAQENTVCTNFVRLSDWNDLKYQISVSKIGQWPSGLKKYRIKLTTQLYNSSGNSLKPETVIIEDDTATKTILTSGTTIFASRRAKGNLMVIIEGLNTDRNVGFHTRGDNQFLPLLGYTCK